MCDFEIPPMERSEAGPTAERAVEQRPEAAPERSVEQRPEAAQERTVEQRSEAAPERSAEEKTEPQAERAARENLDTATTEPRGFVEGKSDYKQAEDVQRDFTAVVDNFATGELDAGGEQTGTLPAARSVPLQGSGSGPSGGYENMPAPHPDAGMDERTGYQETEITVEGEGGQTGEDWGKQDKEEEVPDWEPKPGEHDGWGGGQDEGTTSGWSGGSGSSGGTGDGSSTGGSGGGDDSGGSTDGSEGGDDSDDDEEEEPSGDDESGGEEGMTVDGGSGDEPSNRRGSILGGSVPSGGGDTEDAGREGPILAGGGTGGGGEGGGSDVSGKERQPISGGIDVHPDSGGARPIDPVRAIGSAKAADQQAVIEEQRKKTATG